MAEDPFLGELERLASEPERLPPPADAYRTPAGILKECGRLVRSHDGTARRIGSSHEGRSLWAFRFGPREPGGIFLLSLLHGSEWVGGLALLALAETILGMRPALPLAILPIANPDGVARAHDSAIRLRMRTDRRNARGIDLNRNFPPTHRPTGFWAAVPWYRPGPASASERETAAIVGLARELRPSISLSFHATGRWVFYPPAHRYGRSDATERHRALLETAGGSGRIGYRSGQLGRWSVWFRAPGTELDFLAGEPGSYTFLVEVGRGGFGRWGLRRLAVPFFFYNPRDPSAELADLAAFCATVIEAAIA